MIVTNSKGEQEYLYRVNLEEGKVLNFNKRAFLRETAHLNGEYEWVLRKFKKKRSLEQNNTQWLYFTKIADYTGDTPQKIHSLLSFKFLKVEEPNKITGEIEERIKGTSELDTIEHNHFMENVRDWAKHFLNMELPLPNANWKIDLEEH